MSEQEFITTIVKVASDLKGNQITEAEKGQILKAFNAAQGSAYDCAKAAIELVIGKQLPREGLLLEKSASLNNLANLLNQMLASANKWQASKK